MTKKKLVICSSANFYKHANTVARELEGMGYQVEVPVTIKKMRKSGNFDAAEYRTWLSNPKTYSRKTYLMRNHFEKIVSADAIVVVNDEKRGMKGYIGGNVLMEMGLAFHLKKPIFVLNEVGLISPVHEEIRAMNCTILNQNLKKLNL